MGVWEAKINLYKNFMSNLPTLYVQCYVICTASFQTELSKENTC